LFSHIPDAELLTWALLFFIALIVATAAYLDFGSLKPFQIELGSRRSKEEFLARSRSKTF
jgi:hypothetical protein